MNDRQKTRVLFAIGSLSGGGAERQLIEYLTHLDRSQFVPFLYLVSEEGELRDELPQDIAVEVFWKRHRSPRLNIAGRIYRMQVRDLADVMRLRRIDVLCTITFMLTLIGRSSVRYYPVPWVAIDMADPRLDFDHSTVRFRRFKKKMLCRAYRETSITVAVSDGVKAGLVEYFQTPEEHIQTVHNFVDLSRIDRLARIPCDPVFDSANFNIISIGRLQEQKGHIHLLEALDQLVTGQDRRKLVLHIFGQGPLEGALKEFVSTRRLHENVRFWGFVRSPYNYLAAADLFCLASIYEGLPLVLLEALTCRVPVVATDCPSGPREVLRGGMFGQLVPPANPEALAKAIRQVIDRHDHYRDKAEAGREHVARNYSAKVGTERLQDVLSRACSGSLHEEE